MLFERNRQNFQRCRVYNRRCDLRITNYIVPIAQPVRCAAVLYSFGESAQIFTKAYDAFTAGAPALFDNFLFQFRGKMQFIGVFQKILPPFFRFRLGNFPQIGSCGGKTAPRHEQLTVFQRQSHDRSNSAAGRLRHTRNFISAQNIGQHLALCCGSFRQKTVIVLFYFAHFSAPAKRTTRRIKSRKTIFTIFHISPLKNLTSLL